MNLQATLLEALGVATLRGVPLYHGGVPGLSIGDAIEPGFERRSHPGCPWCEARARGESYNGIDGPSAHTDMVYASFDRLYAKHYASLWGRGDLYRVEAVGPVLPSLEDSMLSVCTPALRVAAILDRAVLLTPTERRRLQREWRDADAAWPERRERFVAALQSVAGPAGGDS
jgi:hypothetical protein